MLTSFGFGEQRNVGISVTPDSLDAVLCLWLSLFLSFEFITYNGNTIVCDFSLLFRFTFCLGMSSLTKTRFFIMSCFGL